MRIRIRLSRTNASRTTSGRRAATPRSASAAQRRGGIEAITPRAARRRAGRRDARGVMASLPPRRWAALALLGVAALLPLVVRDAFVLDSLILILMWGALSAAWNVAGGYAGQVSLGHAAFFGIGAYSAAPTSRSPRSRSRRCS